MIDALKKILHPAELHKAKCHSKGMAGFTFIEIILSLALLSILSAIFGMGLVAAMESYAFSRANADIAQKGQLAMQRISRELSELVEINGVNSDPNYMIYSRVDSALPSKIFMCLYHHGPGTPLYLFSGYEDVDVLKDILADITEIPLPEGHPGKILTDNVQNFSLAYYSGDDDWVFGVDQLSQLSLIQSTLSLIRSDVSDKYTTFRGLVHLRNTDNAGGAHLFEE